MEIIYIIALIATIRAIVAVVRKRQPAITTLNGNTPQSLCSTCAYAHIALGFNEREKLIACTFGGSVRPLKFAVSACTFYFNRAAIPQAVHIAGFAQAGEGPDVLIAAKTSVNGKMQIPRASRPSG